MAAAGEGAPTSGAVFESERLRQRRSLTTFN